MVGFVPSLFTGEVLRRGCQRHAKDVTCCRMEMGRRTSRRGLMRILAGVVAGTVLGSISIPKKQAQALNEEETDAAIEAYKKVTVLQERALEYTNRMDFARAEPVWTEIIAMNERNAPAYSNRGNCRTSLGRFKEAIDDFDKATKFAPDEPDPYLGRGVALEGLGEFRKAIREYEVANEKSMERYQVNDPITWNNRGNAYAGLREWDKAVELYRKAADMAPRTYVFPRANEALALWQVGKRKESLRIMKALVTKYPSFGDVHAALTAAYWEENRGDEAENEWLKTLALDSRYRNIKWVEHDRRWPPALVSSLGRFLKLA